jgi:hypothetical protein
MMMMMMITWQLEQTAISLGDNTRSSDYIQSSDKSQLRQNDHVHD